MHLLPHRWHDIYADISSKPAYEHLNLTPSWAAWTTEPLVEPVTALPRILRVVRVVLRLGVRVALEWIAAALGVREVHVVLRVPLRGTLGDVAGIGRAVLGHEIDCNWDTERVARRCGFRRTPRI